MLTNRATHLCNVLAWLTYMLQCRIWSFCVKGCRHEYRRTPKIGEPWNSALLWWEGWPTPRYTPLPHMCHHVKFGSSATKGVCINRKEPPKLGSAGTPPLRWPVSVRIGVRVRNFWKYFSVPMTILEWPSRALSFDWVTDRQTDVRGSFILGFCLTGIFFQPLLLVRPYPPLVFHKRGTRPLSECCSRYSVLIVRHISASWHWYWRPRG